MTPTAVTIPTAPLASSVTFAPVPEVRGVTRTVTVETTDARETEAVSLRFRVRAEAQGETLTAEYLDATAHGESDPARLDDAALTARGINRHASYMARLVAWAWAEDVLRRAAIAAMPDPDELLDDAD